MLGQARSSVLSFLLLSFLSFDAWLPVQALRNITIDNSDSSAINYLNDDWNFDDSYDSGATDHWSSSPGASATVQFTGVAVYYLVHLYPNTLQAGGLLSVDDYPATSVVMWDPNNDDYGKNWTTAWQMTGLANSTHTLHVNFWDNGNNSFISLDTILVTQLENNDPVPVVPSLATSSTQTSTSATASSTNFNSNPDTTSDSSSSSNKTLPIVLGTVFGLLFLGAVIAAAFFWNRSRRNRAGAASHEPSEAKPFMSSNAPQGAIQFNPFNPEQGMGMQQPFAASGVHPGMNTMDNARTSQYGYPVPAAAGTDASSYSYHSPSPDLRAPNQAMTMSRLINDPATMSYPMAAPGDVRPITTFSSSQTSLYGGQAPSSSHAVGGAMSARLPEV